MPTDFVNTELIELTPAAADAVRDLLARRNLSGYGLRVFVSGGGCSGFQYGLALEDQVREGDLAFDQHGVQLIVDEISIGYLHGATIDYVDELMGSGFKITNPNAISTCGCGNSFRTKDDSYGESGGCSSCA